MQFGFIEFENDFDEDLDKNIGIIVETHNKFVAEYEKTKADVQKLKDDNF